MIQRNQGNIAFPITSSLTVNLTWPWYKGEAIFLHPAIVSDSRTVIINKHHFNQWIRSKMLESLLQAWPLFALTFVLAGLSGVCIWCLEWRTNSKEFNRSFTRGWFEGFWWAFVSMTTVGYGDKTPKTILGRLFAAVWILFGLVMVAVFTATATSAMTSFESGISQARVAVLSSTDASLYAAKQGASVQKFESFNAMYKALQARQVDAILVDHYVGAYHVSKLSHDDLRMLTTKISQARYSMAFIDKESQYIYSECFKTLDAKQGTSYFLEKHATVLKAFDYSSDFGGLFGNEGNSSFMILISSIALGVVLLIGISLEYILNRWCTKCCNTRTMVQELNIMKTFSNDKKEEMPTTRTIYPSPIEVKPNADHSLETLTNEVQRLRITMNQVLEKLNG